MVSGDSLSHNAATNLSLRTDAKVAFQCVYHVVWCPQYRAPVIEGEIEQRLKEIIVEVVQEKGAWLKQVQTMPHYVHLVVEVGPQFGVHRLVKAIKARSAGQLREEYPALRSRLPSMWTNSYLVATQGAGAPPSLIDHFVEQQKPR